MKSLAVGLLSVLCLSGCDPIPELEPAKPISQEDLKKASDIYCPTGQEFTEYTADFQLGMQSFPKPALFGIRKGTTRCALTSKYQEGGIWTWLTVDFSGSCLENGSLWQIDSYGVMDGDHFHLSLKPYEHDDGVSFIQILTSYGRHLDYISSKSGLVLFSCTNK